jgi:predicted ATPase
MLNDKWIVFHIYFARELRMSDVPTFSSNFNTATGDSCEHNLPGQFTSFVGRACEVSEIKQSLSDPRLLTLTGTGGVGKTRLALQVASELVRSNDTFFDGGVWFVEFAHVVDSTLLLLILVHSLGLEQDTEEALLTTLCTFLRHKHILLILDSCEHLVDACARLVESLLQRCPDLHILVTSREILGLSGETIYGLSPLSNPPSTTISPDNLSLYEATALFIERARTVHPYFCVNTRNTSIIVKTCQQLDGIPLAIELVAAWVRIMTVECAVTSYMIYKSSIATMEKHIANV